MKITRRIISSKQHTVGYVLTNGRQVTRPEAIRLASSGQLNGVRIVRGSPPYLMSTTDRNLYDLPETAASSVATVSRTARSSRRSSRSRSASRRSSR